MQFLIEMGLRMLMPAATWRFAISSAICLFASTIALDAQERATIDRDWIGIWRQGSCDERNLTLAANGHSVVAFYGDDVTARIVLGTADFRDRLILISGPNGREAIATADLVSCSGMPSKLQIAFGEAIELFLSFGELIEYCSTASGEECIQRGFREVDVTGDAKLSRAEISRFGRGLAFFAGYETSVSVGNLASSGPAHQVSGADLYGSAVVSNLLAPLFSANILASYDFDADGLLSPDELLLDRNGIAVDDISLLLGRESIQTSVNSISNLLGGLGFPTFLNWIR